MSRTSNATLSGFRLRIHRPNASTLEHPLEDGRSVFVGASDSCGIQVKGDRIAQIHCLIDVEGQTVSLQDWASDAGTRINGTAIEEKTALTPGDRIEVGGITLELAGSPAPQPAAAASAEAEEPLEESIGMETLGYDDPIETVAEGQAEPVIASDDPRPRLETPAGRLSDAISPVRGVPDRREEPVGGPDAECLDGEQGEPEDGSDCGIEVSAPLAADAAEVLATTPADGLAEPDEQIGLAPARGALAEDWTRAATHPASAEDLDWDPGSLEDEEIDAEIVQLLKQEVEDLRIQLAERDEQLAAMQQAGDDGPAADPSHCSGDAEQEDHAGEALMGRVDELLAELAEHDERVATLQELLQTAEIQNQAEREERNCLETWVGEIEQRIGQREAEWLAEQEGLRERLEAACQERDRFQQQLHSAAQRYGKAAQGEAVPDEVLQKLQTRNAELEAALDESEKERAGLQRQLERLNTVEPDSLQAEKAELAKQKAEVSRLRFQLSKQLQELGNAPSPKDHPDDREFAYKLQTLREHLREIHEEEKSQQEQRGESLFGRISGLWKRVEDRY